MQDKVKVEVLESGLHTTLQDLGRPGSQQFGVPRSGAMDRYAQCAANELVGNKPEAAALEIIYGGPALRFEQSALIAVTGANMRPTLNHHRLPLWCSVFVRAGETLRFESKAHDGRIAYLGIHGGWDGRLYMGSRSTYARAGLGRPLRPGDTLFTALDYLNHFSSYTDVAGKFFPEKKIPSYTGHATVRVVPGPYLENFSAEAINLFFTRTFKVAPESDRMGYRLQGAPLSYERPDLAEIAACGTVFGTIQVPPDGQPIILMADHQVTGGYPVIGVVVEEDLPPVAQLLPGHSLNFKKFTG
jgi:antagonist of KipI